MNALGEVTVAFVVETALLAGFWVGLSLIAGLGISLAFGRRPGPASAPAVLWALAGAVTAGSLAARFDAPSLLVTVGRRQVPLLWSLGGAVAAALLHSLLRRRSAAVPAQGESGSTRGQSA